MTKPELPHTIYAAAGAGELAYQKLRTLPDVARRTVRNAGQTAGEFRQRLTTGDGNLSVRLRESAARGRSAVRHTATAAQQRAAAGYRNLVARGERVMAERIGNQRTEESPVEVIVGPVQPAERSGATAGAQTGAQSAAQPGGGQPTQEQNH